ncbi:MAG: M23 family metallopeptidase [Verrucomicrobia bacterium]|nr:M23 family metallopeptidase [Verrucomicrobiota bacterium]
MPLPIITSQIVVWPALLVVVATTALAQPFKLPTANRALFERGGEERFFAPTVGKPWTSGTFGCVRTDGWQMHEGIDIRAVKRDRRGEPIDPVMATADGTVAYINQRTGLSNFGRYIILRHDIEGLEIYSLYAHLSEIRAGLRAGTPVKAGETIGVMGRSTNTRQQIGKDRAHLHFELDLLINDRFPEWFKKAHPSERNDHGAWNGRNLVGLDPRRLFLEQQSRGSAFSLRQFVQQQTELFRVLVRDTRIAWLRRYPGLMVANPRLGTQPVAGYELVLDYNGLPFQAISRPAADFAGVAKYRLLSVNAAEYDRNHCRKLVTRHGNSWLLSTQGQSLLDLLTY